MSTKCSDSDPKAEEFQISLLRRASVAERLARTRSLSRSVIRLSRRAIERANPELDEKEKNLVFIAHCYGNRLADRLRAYVKRRDQ
jgi:hypothetical protein